MKQKPLAERIKEIQAECDAYMDAKAEIVRKETGGNVPFAVVRGLIADRAPGCRCRAALLEIEKDPN